MIVASTRLALGCRVLWGRSEKEEGDDEHSNGHNCQSYEDGQAHSTRLYRFVLSFAVAAEDVSGDPAAALGAGVDEACEAIIGRDSHAVKVWAAAAIAPEAGLCLWTPFVCPQVIGT